MNIKGRGNIFEPNAPVKKSNSKAFILIGIVVVLCLIIILCYIQMANKEVPVRASVDGTYVNGIVEKMVVEDGVTYFPIKYMASIFGYSAYNGDSQVRSEDSSKCYVECEDEVVNISYNSTRVYKYLKNNSQVEYDYVDLNKKVISKNGELYMSYDGISKVFNTAYYNDQNNKVHIFQTLENKYSSLNKTIMDYSNIGASAIDSQFINKKALVENLAIVRSAQDSRYGILDISDSKNPKIVLELKYDEIKFIPSLKMFLVTSNGKKGIFQKDGSTLFNIEFQDLSLIDPDTKLFVVKKDNKFGISRSRYETKLDIEYEQIGIDSSLFTQNGVVNKYFLVGNLIPVKKDGKWGLVDKECNKLTDCIYEQLGSNISSSGSKSNLLYIPDYNMIIAKRDNKYALLNSSGEEKIANVIDECYIYNNDGKSQYTMIINDKEYDIVDDYLKQKSSVSVKSANSSNDVEYIAQEIENSNDQGQTFGDYYQEDNNDDNDYYDDNDDYNDNNNDNNDDYDDNYEDN